MKTFLELTAAEQWAVAKAAVLLPGTRDEDMDDGDILAVQSAIRQMAEEAAAE